MDLGESEHDRVFKPVSKKELFSFRHLFSSMIVGKLTQDHLWLGEPVYKSPEALLLHDLASVRHGRQRHVLEENWHHCPER